MAPARRFFYLVFLSLSLFCIPPQVPLESCFLFSKPLVFRRSASVEVSSCCSPHFQLTLPPSPRGIESAPQFRFSPPPPRNGLGPVPAQRASPILHWPLTQRFKTFAGGFLRTLSHWKQKVVRILHGHKIWPLFFLYLGFLLSAPAHCQLEAIC